MIAQNGGIKYNLTGDGMIQRLAADGHLLGESKIPDGELEKFKTLAGRSQRRDENVFAERACVVGLGCSEDSTCWYNGCDGCLFISTGVGFCYGTSW